MDQINFGLAWFMMQKGHKVRSNHRWEKEKHFYTIKDGDLYINDVGGKFDGRSTKMHYVHTDEIKGSWQLYVREPRVFPTIIEAIGALSDGVVKYIRPESWDKSEQYIGCVTIDENRAGAIVYTVVDRITGVISLSEKMMPFILRPHFMKEKWYEIVIEGDEQEDEDEGIRGGYES